MELALIQAAMDSGITVTSNPDPAQLQRLSVTSWPTWGCEVSTFPVDGFAAIDVAQLHANNNSIVVI
jgi:hypothetical protein